MCVCGDYKLTVNLVSKLETYPLPRIENLLASLTNGKTFSKLDLAHAYLQVKRDQSVKKYVIINTHKSLYVYNYLPFGVVLVPAIFKGMIDNILQGLSHVCIYIDDILVTGTSEKEHLKNLDEALQRLEMQVSSGEKCNFMLTAVKAIK